ncbi:transcriptional regulator [Alistipes sp. An116]|uniref:helix-turn-helix domain-containing protein n=1 Tax=unclassified Alistipes TaxID=2608932 RepID=UPI000B394ABD|nr:transcriptional regulator [Alistipes sp. An54]OUQ53567.1 transcriptional regulator [Alistipes sp. An116]
MKQVRNQELLLKIALKIKQLREEKGVSQEIMYMDTQIHVARIETAKVNISVSTLDAICRYFGISMEEFFRSF